jgi:hypothetical protein
VKRRGATLLGAVLAALSLAIGSAALAQGAAKEERLPLGFDKLEIEGGYKADYVEGRKSEGWYRLTYKGKPVAERGTSLPFTETVLLDAPKADLKVSDDTDLVLRFEDGTLGLAGGLFDMSGVRPISFTGLEGLNLRGTAFVAADNSFKQVQFGAGLQTEPMRVPGLAGREVANWIVLGVNAQRRDSTDAAADNSFAAATYRAFVGKAFGWRTPAKQQIEALARRLADAYLRDAPTMTEALAKKTQIDNDKNSGTEQRRFARAVTAARLEIRRKLLDTKRTEMSEEEMTAIWTSAAREFEEGAIEAISLRPTVAVYAELSGWYEFRGGGTSSRSKSLFTLSADYWFLPGRDDVFLRVRYENGHERGAPDMRKNQLLTSVALRF